MNYAFLPQITMIDINKMPTIIILLTAFITALLGIYLFCWISGRLINPLKIYNQQNKLVMPKSEKRKLIITTIIAGCLIFIGGYNINSIITSAANSGANSEAYIKDTKIKHFYQKTWLNMPYSDFEKNTAQSFPIKMPPKNKRSILIVLYRFNCPYCHKIKKQTMALIKKKHLTKITYYVPSRSNYGHQLVERNNIETVPTLVYIDRNGNEFADNMMRNNSHGEPKFNLQSFNYYTNLAKNNY